MNSKMLKIKKVREKAVVPKYATSGAAGMDLYACIDEAVTLAPGGLLMIPTGIAIELPDGRILLEELILRLLRV